MLIPTCLIKFMELSLTIACLTLHHYSYDLTDLPTLMLCSGTYVGFIVVLSGEIIGEMIFAPLDLVQDMFFGILGVGLFITSGGFVIAGRNRKSSCPRTGDHLGAMVCGSISIATGIIMFFDLSLAYLDSEEFEEEAPSM
ncbi:uncharacterized protein LOC128673887 isoform X2 [Plodia interpunctella]|uniref:uncharacterized protein LOC128673887 isoform X2 n=1 Tax=Plodia interpunctella TaxID=58824 RepID=UPI0023682DA2|nr:uncharacterized protein LOC128673887 isoform X2 [Plodia interpunctella]